MTIRDRTHTVCSVYKNDMTGHWMVDRGGTKAHPGSPMWREGFTTFEAARENAAEVVDFYAQRYPYGLRLWKDAGTS